MHIALVQQDTRVVAKDEQLARTFNTGQASCEWRGVPPPAANCRWCGRQLLSVLSLAQEPSAPTKAYDSDSVCDPTVVRFRDTWFLYHTCINTANPPDGYTNNRICVATSDSITGPYVHRGEPVIQDLACSKNARCEEAEGAAYRLASVNYVCMQWGFSA